MGAAWMLKAKLPAHARFWNAGGTFDDFRQALMRHLADQRLPVKVRSLAAQGMQASPFSEPVVAHMRQLFATWASDQGYTSEISWDKPRRRTKQFVCVSKIGLLGLRTQLPGQPAKYYFYTVCPFGAVFSALWFARVGAFLVRVLHMLIWIRHMLGMYVDDLIGSTDEQAVYMVATVTLAFCDIFGFPISWRKVQSGHSIDWIGWSFHFRAGAVSVPISKRQKLCSGIQRLLSSERFLKQDLHPVCSLYSDLRTLFGINYSIAHGDWPELIHHLAPDLRFTSSPRGTAISKGAKLLSVRHKQISSLADIKLVPVTERRIWIRVADPANSRRKLSYPSRSLLRYWLRWAQDPPLMVPMSDPFLFPATAAADAMAEQDYFAIGSFLETPSKGFLSFSEKWSVRDLSFTGLELSDKAQSYIASFEALAQIALLHVLTAALPGGRMRVRIKSWSDNTGAESQQSPLHKQVSPQHVCSEAFPFQLLFGRVLGRISSTW